MNGKTISKVRYNIGPVPGWFKHDVHRAFIEERFIETAHHLYGDTEVEFTYEMNKPYTRRLYGHEGHIISAHKFNTPVTMLNKVKADAEGASTKELKPR